jgi:superfamily II DNA/RNA helicase
MPDSMPDSLPSSSPLSSFDSFGLHPALLRTLQTKAYAAPTPIQHSAMPCALQGHDVLASAQTGSGKTAAYALPALQHLASQTSPYQRRISSVSSAMPSFTIIDPSLVGLHSVHSYTSFCVPDT